MLEVKRQVITVMKWYKTGDCETNTHIHNHTQYITISFWGDTQFVRRKKRRSWLRQPKR